jgi:hypothetical protein
MSPLMLWRSTAPKRLESALMQIPTRCRRADPHVLVPQAIGDLSPGDWVLKGWRHLATMSVTTHR